MRRLAAAIDTSDMESSVNREQQQQQHSAVYRCNGVFLAFFQTTHIWGNLVSVKSRPGLRPGTRIWTRTLTCSPVWTRIRIPTLTLTLIRSGVGRRSGLQS